MNLDLEAYFSSPENLAILRKSVAEKHYSFPRLSDHLLRVLDQESKGLGKAALLFSGGIDSSLLAFLLSFRIPRIQLFTLGLPRSASLERSTLASSLLNLPLEKVEVEKAALIPYVEAARAVLPSPDSLQLQIGVGEFILLERIQKAGYPVVFSGQGPDELFAGYDEFRKTLSEKGYPGVQALCWEKMDTMNERNVRREAALARHFQLDVRTPYLSPDFMAEALRCPPEKKISGPQDFERKLEFRRLAESLGLPRELLHARKKAMQYDSGLARALEGLI